MAVSLRQQLAFSFHLRLPAVDHMLTCAIFAVMLKEQPPLRLHLDLLYVQESLWNDHPALSYSFTVPESCRSSELASKF